MPICLTKASFGTIYNVSQMHLHNKTIKLYLHSLNTHIQTHSKNKRCVTLWPHPFALKRIFRQKEKI
jgi:hypothetical protein